MVDRIECEEVKKFLFETMKNKDKITDEFIKEIYNIILII